MSTRPVTRGSSVCEASPTTVTACRAAVDIRCPIRYGGGRRRLAAGANCGQRVTDKNRVPSLYVMRTESDFRARPRPPQLRRASS
ncbi:hypothetical protein EVAR_66024_1 [Eumeta japonica]|uniref:Uncharacterized protein n=1 Tax=Eumeta variegata TaxID=151549 RepID=A0A4C1Z5Z4_EUMVA|nr:hypothetical protein EVAR_66024_1 [Eumeta japonica]